MGLFLVLGLVVASTPDAGATAVPEAFQVVASCALPSALGDAEQVTSERVNGRAVRFREVQGPSGSGGYVTWREWLVVPGTCRTVALQLDCTGGNPSCSARVIHRPGQPPTEQERALLLSWLGGGKLDRRKSEHQSAVTPRPQGLPPQPEATEEDASPEAEAPERSRASKKATAPFTVRAVTQPSPRWMSGPPVPQALSWTESGTVAEQEESSYEVPEGFVSSGRLYSVHRGDCCVREDEVREEGSSRLHFLSSPSPVVRKVSYVVLEQPKRRRSAWLIASASSPRLLGVHGGRAWLSVPVYLDPGFSLLAIDLDTGAAWNLDLERTPSFDPEAYLPREATREGLVLDGFEEETAQEKRTVPWALLERALEKAKPPAR